MNLMHLPDVVLDEIFSHLSFDEVSKSRVVSKEWNDKCKEILTRGFYAVEKYHAQSFKDVKALLPRRESERRNHVLARHCDILTAIETRLSMLSMTFTKYIDVGLCCFIPGKVIDEIFRVLKFIKDLKHPPRAHEILQELRDISSMAMEHFDEKIVPRLKEAMAFSASYPITGGPRYTCSRVNANSSPHGSTLVTQRVSANAAYQRSVQNFRSELVKYSLRTQRSTEAITKFKRTLDKFIIKTNQRTSRQSLHFRFQRAKLMSQDAKLAKQDKKIKDQDTQIAEMKRQLEEWDHKLTDLTAKLNKVPEPDVAVKKTRSSKRGLDVKEKSGSKKTRID